MTKLAPDSCHNPRNFKDYILNDTLVPEGRKSLEENAERKEYRNNC